MDATLTTAIGAFETGLTSVATNIVTALGQALPAIFTAGVISVVVVLGIVFYLKRRIARV